MEPYKVRLINYRGLCATLFIPPDKDVLSALQSHGLDLSLSHCHTGTCMYCVGRLVSGELDYTSCSFLSATHGTDTRELVLLCQVSPRSDCTIETYLID